MLKYKTSKTLAAQIDEFRLRLAADYFYLNTGDLEQQTVPEEVDAMTFDRPQPGHKPQRPNHQKAQKINTCQVPERPASTRISTRCRNKDNCCQPQPRAEQAECNMKNCYCLETKPIPKPSTVQTSDAPMPKSEHPRPQSSKSGLTWDQILSQHFSQTDSATKGDHPAVNPRSCWGCSCQKSSRTCSTACFVDEIVARNPEDLVQLKNEVDKALKRTGLSRNSLKDERKVVTDRSKVVLEYLEELSLDVLKKRLEESETKYRAMKKKTEDVLVSQKMEILRLQNEIHAKNEETNKLKNLVDEANAHSKSRELSLVNRVEMLENRLTNALDKEEKSSAQSDRYKRELASCRLELNMTAKDRDLFKAKMEIYQAERDKAVSSLSVYEKTFKSLKSELGREIALIRPSPNLTADSCGTLGNTGRLSPDVVTSSPNVSTSAPNSRHFEWNRMSSTPMTKNKERRARPGLPNLDRIAQEDSDKSSHYDNLERNVERSGGVGRIGEFVSTRPLPQVLDRLKGLASQFKKFSDDVIPLANNLDKEAKEIVNSESLSSACTGTDVDSLSIDSASIM